MPAALFTPTFLYMLGGLIVWGVRFLAVYSFTALACARGWSEATPGGIGLVPLVVGIATLVAVLGCVALLAKAVTRLGDRSSQEGAENTRFVHIIAASVAALAILAMVWETLPFLLITGCG